MEYQSSAPERIREGKRYCLVIYPSNADRFLNQCHEENGESGIKDKASPGKAVEFGRPCGVQVPRKGQDRDQARNEGPPSER